MPRGGGSPHAHPALTPRPCALSGTVDVSEGPTLQQCLEWGGILLCPLQPFLPSPFSGFFFFFSLYNKTPKSPATEKPLFVPLFPLLSAAAEYRLELMCCNPLFL